MKRYVLYLLLIAAGTSRAQPPGLLTLDECYALAEQHYPQVRQRELIAATSAYTIDNLSKGYWPQLTINGQATYQSAVTQIPVSLPGISIATPDKDQYKVYGELNQLLYDGGVIARQKQLQRTSEHIEQRKLESELYQLKERINQLFFGILLLDGQLQQNELLLKDIETGLKEVQAAVANGVAFRSNADLLKADLLKAKQRSTELLAARKGYADMLGLFTGRELTAHTVLQKPAQVQASREINRPELGVYAEQDKHLDIQHQQLTAKTLPRLGFFLQGGLGRPALNMLDNSFEAYYIGGFRLTWSPSAFYTMKKDRALIETNRKMLNAQKETFLFNTGLTIKQQSAETLKYRELLSADDEIIALRARVKAAALAQLSNGVISGSDYLRETNAEDQARQSRIIHEIQLLLSEYNLQTTTGNQ